MVFCTDVDLLYWEPNLPREAAFASQQLLSGTGNLAGTRFTLASGSLNEAHAAAEQVVVLSGSVEGCFPIVSVDSATQLTLSVLYDGLYPEQGPAQPSPVGSGEGLTFAIRTFWPQRCVVSELLTRAAGLEPGTTGGTIVNGPSLKRVCVLGTLQMIYSALAAAAAETSKYGVRAELYERLYRRAMGQAKVQVDLDGDGRAETVRALNMLECRRI